MSNQNSKDDSFVDTDFTYRPDAGDHPGDYGDHPGDDLPKKGKGASIQTLGDYLSAVTRGKAGSSPRPNTYPVGASDHGLTLPAEAAGDVNSNSFENDVLSPEQAATLDQYSNGYAEGGFYERSQKPGWPVKEPVLVKNSRAHGFRETWGQESKTGDNLLTSILEHEAPPGSEAEIPDKASGLQQAIPFYLQKNRFNPSHGETPFVESGDLTKGMYSAQGTLGEYDPNADKVGIDDLKHIAQHMLVKTSGEEPTDPDAGFLDAIAQDLRILLPSFVQLGMSKTDATDYYPRYMEGAPKTGQNRDGSGGTSFIGQSFNDSDGQRKSYGTLNSPLEPFGGPAPLHTAMVAAAGACVMMGLSYLIQGLLKVKMRIPDESSDLEIGDPEKPGSYPMGRRIRDKDWTQKLYTFFGMPYTYDEMGACLNAGIKTFYGLSSPPGSNPAKALSMVEGSKNLLLSPGYYAGVIRNAIRDAEQIHDRTAAATSPTISGAIGAVITLIDAIATSATFRFLMVMVQIGNIDTGYSQMGSKELGGGDINSLAENAQTRMAKSRVVGTPGREGMLAWRHTSVPSFYLLPKSSLGVNLKKIGVRSGMGYTAGLKAGVIAAGGNSSMDSGPFTVEEGLAPEGPAHDSDLSPVRNGRISHEVVRTMENMLEMEYVPFYFHDLRTNEIIAFHAFLDQVSDSFSPDYSSTGGIGRIDDVMTYSKTKRTMTVSFIVAATSKEDFDMMWWDINRLCAMLYPQWSAGTTVSGLSQFQKFIMPFSQIQTSSPMIRLRVGDIIKSNYTDMSMARLFGADFPDQVGSPLQIESSGEAATNAAKAKAQEEKKNAQIAADTARTAEVMEKAAEMIKRMMRGRGAVRSVDSPVGINVGEPCIIPERAYVGKKPWTVDGTRLGALTDKGLKTVLRRAGMPPAGGAGTVTGRYSYSARRKVKTPLVKFQVPGDNFGDSSEAAVPEWMSTMGLLEGIAEEGTEQSIEAEQYINYRALGYIVEFNDPVQIGSHGKHKIEIRVPAGRIKVDEQHCMSEAGVQTAAITVGDVTPEAAVTTFPSLQKFFDFAGDGNAVIRSFRSAGGRGMAGFITSFNMDYQNATWETEQIGSRAPKMVKINLNFAPIHDIPPGLSHDGSIQAPTHPVGEVVNNVYGDRWGENITSTKRGTLGGALTQVRSKGIANALVGAPDSKDP